jgi:7-cyano-7-deazaguanine synthase
VSTVAVLAGGGLDSCVLVADLAQAADVYPLCMERGLAWEPPEQAALHAFVSRLANPRVHDVSVLPMPMGALLGRHWSVTGDTPRADEPDTSVFIPGHNVLLLAAAATWCATHGVHRIALASLAGNPFPDATPAFFAAFALLLSTALDHEISVETPYRELHKAELIRRHAGLPLELTLTCNSPDQGRHCGRCNKCHERRGAFAVAGVEDRTSYANDR